MIEISCTIKVPATSDTEALDKLYEVLTAAGIDYYVSEVIIHEN